MPTDISIQKKNNKTEHFVVDTVDENMRDYSQEPFFIKKTEQAMATLKKYGLPKELQNKLTKK